MSTSDDDDNELLSSAPPGLQSGGTTAAPTGRAGNVSLITDASGTGTTGTRVIFPWSSTRSPYLYDTGYGSNGSSYGSYSSSYGSSSSSSTADQTEDDEVLFRRYFTTTTLNPIRRPLPVRIPILPILRYDDEEEDDPQEILEQYVLSLSLQEYQPSFLRDDGMPNRLRFQEIVAAPDGDGAEDRCMICLEPYRTTTTITRLGRVVCGHVFHVECLLRLQEFHRRCPCCRRDCTGL